jgi:hypothetical protein
MGRGKKMKKQSQFNGRRQITGDRSQKEKIENKANVKMDNLLQAL